MAAPTLQTAKIKILPVETTQLKEVNHAYENVLWILRYESCKITYRTFEGLCDDPRVWIPPPVLMSIPAHGFAIDCAHFIWVALIHGRSRGIRRIRSLGVKADKEREGAKHGKHRAASEQTMS